MTIQQKIKAIREAKGITQTFIANSIGMDKANYLRMEQNAGNRIYYETIVKICDALGVTFWELIIYAETAPIKQMIPTEINKTYYHAV